MNMFQSPREILTNTNKFVAFRRGLIEAYIPKNLALPNSVWTHTMIFGQFILQNPCRTKPLYKITERTNKPWSLFPEM